MTYDETKDQSATSAQDFNSLVEEHSGFVYNVAFRMMGNHEDA
jgi:DNA-directed RNA polymerase specialized sigma24 family protein